MKQDKHFNQPKHENINKKEILEKITPLIENTSMRYNLIPVEIDFTKENHRWFLRIFLYSPVKEVTLDDCEGVSRSLNDFLDELIPVKYYLEVSSPGIERKLKSDKEFIIFKGKDINLKLKNAVDDSYDKQFVAKIMDFDEAQGLKIFRYKDKQEFIIPKDNIQSARLYASDI